MPASRRSSRACPDTAPPGRVLVLGAGACRLAYDLHQRPQPSVTAALDFNPFFLLAARRNLAGPPLELYEFPIAPRSIADHAQLRVHAAPKAPAAGFMPVLADASAPPFGAGQFDLVLTPWFIDVAGEPATQVARRVNALLNPGGLWVNHGSLDFRCRQPVPLLPQFCAHTLSTRAYAFLLAMIDGERTIRDMAMARLMTQQKLMPADDALPAIRRFLARAFEATDRRPQF